LLSTTVLSRSLFFFHCPPPPRALPSFPTRRSSDLHARGLQPGAGGLALLDPAGQFAGAGGATGVDGDECPERTFPASFSKFVPRSEEHTSELQSLTNLVCRLLLEKKNTKQTYTMSC